jgi:hypothetical protein
MSKRYIYPALSNICGFGVRLGGAGLGNSLFVLSRAIVLAKQYKGELINPDWISIKLGPILRNERDKRIYLHFFKPMGITGLKKTALKLFSAKKNEEYLITNGEQGKETAIIMVSGLKNYFEDIRHERKLISASILNNVHHKNAKEIAGFNGTCIGVHIRMGDFQPEWRVPISWFVKTIHKIRAFLSYDVLVCIFSDGRDDELMPITMLPNVRRISFRNALTELICLSKCDVILASNSTYSAWAVFLGNKPSLWKYRNQEFENLLTDAGLFEGVVLEDEELPALLVANLEQIFFENAQA